VCHQGSRKERGYGGKGTLTPSSHFLRSDTLPVGDTNSSTSTHFNRLRDGIRRLLETNLLRHAGMVEKMSYLNERNIHERFKFNIFIYM
jgi:hypothetical protein